MNQNNLEADLTAVVSGGVDFSQRRRAEYSADASNYRRVPLGVAFPADRSEIIAAVRVCREHNVPVTVRGGGTSVAGNAIGDGIVLDVSRHCNRILAVDPEKQTAIVEPGVVLDQLQAEVLSHGLRFGPDPSTHSRCTIGGMIGNNACGARSLLFGRTADNVISLDILTIDGVEATISTGTNAEALGEIATGIDALVAKNEQLIRDRLGKFPRQVSGYSLEHLLPENGNNLARTLVGTEGTCVIVLAATVRLVPFPQQRGLAALGFGDLGTSGDAVRELLPYNTITIEGMDTQVVEMLRRQRPDAVSQGLLPKGEAWLLVEMYEDISSTLLDELMRVSGAIDGRVIPNMAEQKRLWNIREAGAGLASRTPEGDEAWPGWEDAAVPPEELGNYLREFRQLLDRYGRRGAIYGHFGEGCVHTRIDFDFARQQGVEQFRAFIREACELVARFGGSYSGEHGDGLARSEFLPLMYGEELVSVFAQFKRLWDPNGLLNPGVVIEPPRVDEYLRVDPRRKTIPVETAFQYPHDDGDIAKGVRRCVGVGKCRSDSGGVMCPSYRATRDEKDSTRGRARVLHEMLTGDVITDGWRSNQVADALDLCLSCKGCKSDCPVNVDMATYKAEFLHQHYAGKLRPASHYSLGWFPLWARLASYAPRLANLIAASPLATIGKRVGGVTEQRPVPKFANKTFRSWFAQQGFVSEPVRRDVLLWVDTFTNFIAPEIGMAAVKVMHAAGFNVLLSPERTCCGITWVSTGQLDKARKVLQHSVDALGPALLQGIPMVGLEPSCTAVFRSDVLELLGETPTTRAVHDGTLTFAEFLDTHAASWELPQANASSLTQLHCHQHAVMGGGADERVLKRLGFDNSTLDAGCCGLAGNFGFEREHYDVSVAVAEHGLLPKLRSASAETVVISDGFSCRTQIGHLSERTPFHLAQVIADALE